MLQMPFNETGTDACYQQKSDNANQDVTENKFPGQRSFHSLFTSNLYPIPHTVAIDQLG